MTQYGEGTEVAGRFVILDSLGEGGMGAVYRALQTSLDREVALKVLHSQVAFTPRARRRFGREARAVARLNHPHIAAVYDFGADNQDQTLWLAMELVEGTSMTGLKREDIDILRLLSITDQVLSALSAAHARGIIHRDLKPSNVLLTHDDDNREIIKLVDFGLASTQDGELSLDNAPGGLHEETKTEPNSRVIMGTPRYMAPEIFRRKPVDPRVDIYALGVILFEILSGAPPYPGDDPRVVMRGHLKQPIPQLEAREGVEIPTELERVVYKLLAKNPEERHQSANEVREEIQGLMGNYSFVPWMTGPMVGDLSGVGNMSHPSFLSSFGSQTRPPAAMLGGSRPGVSASRAPLVGRSNERRAIEQRIRSAIRDQIGGLVTLEAEGGMGKTRLVEWLRVRVEEAGLMRAAEGHYSRSGGGFDGIRAALDQLLGTSELTYDEVPEAIHAKLARWELGDDEIATCIELMRPGGESILFDGSGAASDARVSRQERVFAVIERVLRKSAAERPVLLILENLHEAGETTYDFLEHLAVGMHLNPAPILVVGTVNSDMIEVVPELRDALARLGKFGTDLLRLRLKRMELAEATTLVQQILPLDDELATKIAQRSDGNPLYLTQMLRYLQESEKLFFGNGKWQLADDVDIASEVPDEMLDMMRLRADRSAERYVDPQALRQILERCAILGHRFAYRLLNAFIAAEEDEVLLGHLDSVLEYLVREGLLTESGNSAEDVLGFNHSLMRDMLLKDMSGRRVIQTLHRLAAEAKIVFYGSRRNQHALEIAEHYRKARDPQGVYVFTVKAARSAMASSDLDTAIRLYRDAMALADAGDSMEENLDVIESMDEISAVLRTEEVYLEVAHLELKIGEYGQARQHYRTLLKSENREVAAWARWGLGELARVQGEFDESTGWFEAAIREARGLAEKGALDTASRVEAHCLHGLGEVDYLRGELRDASNRLKQALEKARSQDEKILETKILRTLSDVVWKGGDAGTADIYRRRAGMLAETLGDDENLAYTNLHAAQYLQQIGQPLRAQEHAEAALQTFEKTGKQHAYAHCILTLGHLAWARGDYREAAGRYRESHRFYEGYDDRRGTTHCKLRLAELAFSIKKLKEAGTLLRDALDGYRAMGDQVGMADCRVLGGRIELRGQKPQLALTAFIDVARDMEDRGDVAGVIAVKAQEALAREMLKEHDAVELLVSEIFESVKTMPVAHECFARALDSLANLLNERKPELAMEIDTLAGEAWQMLGRRVVVT